MPQRSHEPQRVHLNFENGVSGKDLHAADERTNELLPILKEVPNSEQLVAGLDTLVEVLGLLQRHEVILLLDSMLAAQGAFSPNAILQLRAATASSRPDRHSPAEHRPIESPARYTPREVERREDVVHPCGFQFRPAG
jgi:hypothetical protein